MCKVTSQKHLKQKLGQDKVEVRNSTVHILTSQDPPLMSSFAEQIVMARALKNKESAKAEDSQVHNRASIQSCPSV